MAGHGETGGLLRVLDSRGFGLKHSWSGFRFVVLSEGTLQVYKVGALASPGSIPVTQLVSRASPRDDLSLCLDIFWKNPAAEGGSRSMKLRADSVESRDLWVRALKDSSSNEKGVLVHSPSQRHADDDPAEVARSVEEDYSAKTPAHSSSGSWQRRLIALQDGVLELYDVVSIHCLSMRTQSVRVQLEVSVDASVESRAECKPVVFTVVGESATLPLAPFEARGKSGSSRTLTKRGSAEHTLTFGASSAQERAAWATDIQRYSAWVQDREEQALRETSERRQVIAKGWMSKKGPLPISKWKRRFFVYLSTRELVYKNSETSGEVLGCVDLAEVVPDEDHIRVSTAPSDAPSRRMLEIRTPRRTWHFCPEDVQSAGETTDDALLRWALLLRDNERYFNSFHKEGVMVKGLSFQSMLEEYKRLVAEGVEEEYFDDDDYDDDDDSEDWDLDEDDSADEESSVNPSARPLSRLFLSRGGAAYLENGGSNSSLPLAGNGSKSRKSNISTSSRRHTGLAGKNTTSQNPPPRHGAKVVGRSYWQKATGNLPKECLSLSPYSAQILAQDLTSSITAEESREVNAEVDVLGAVAKTEIESVSAGSADKPRESFEAGETCSIDTERTVRATTEESLVASGELRGAEESSFSKLQTVSSVVAGTAVVTKLAETLDNQAIEDFDNGALNEPSAASTAGAENAADDETAVVAAMPFDEAPALTTKPRTPEGTDDDAVDKGLGAKMSAGEDGVQNSADAAKSNGEAPAARCVVESALNESGASDDLDGSPAATVASEAAMATISPSDTPSEESILSDGRVSQEMSSVESKESDDLSVAKMPEPADVLTGAEALEERADSANLGDGLSVTEVVVADAAATEDTGSTVATTLAAPNLNGDEAEEDPPKLPDINEAVAPEATAMHAESKDSEVTAREADDTTGSEVADAPVREDRNSDSIKESGSRATAFSKEDSSVGAGSEQALPPDRSRTMSLSLERMRNSSSVKTLIQRFERGASNSDFSSEK